MRESASVKAAQALGRRTTNRRGQQRETRGKGSPRLPFPKRFLRVMDALHLDAMVDTTEVIHYVLKFILHIEIAVYIRLLDLGV